ncbi:MAG TPA: DsrE family protein [Clostridiaceae bacterium]|nr:DsrE family protein [Clostridiaceae bacterium]
MSNQQSLFILWTNADPLTAKHMVMMYATNAKMRGWWEEVTVIVWGATAKLVAEDEDIQSYIERAQSAGVQFSACIACAQNLDVIEKLTALNIEIKGWGEPLTELLKKDAKLLMV